MLPGAIGIFELHGQIVNGAQSFLYTGFTMKEHQLSLKKVLLVVSMGSDAH